MTFSSPLRSIKNRLMTLLMVAATVVVRIPLGIIFVHINEQHNFILITGVSVMDETLGKIELILSGMFGREGASLLVDDLKLGFEEERCMQTQSAAIEKYNQKD